LQQVSIIWFIAHGKYAIRCSNCFPFLSPFTVTVDVVAANDVPVANDDSASTMEDTPVTVSVLSNDSDPDGHALNIMAITTDPSNGDVTVKPDGTIKYTPDKNFFGRDTFVYQISDGNGGTDTATGKDIFTKSKTTVHLTELY